jgi:phospholipid/cholesterol/gamma-HCH transport system ATP-binding protein
MIEFRNVRKSFSRQPVLRGLSFSVSKGELLFLLGRSGSGKSVALRHIVGLVRPDEGEILVEGQPVQSMNSSELGKHRRRCSLVFQLPALLDSRTLWENLDLAQRGLPSQERWQRAESVLKRVGLADLLPFLTVRHPPQLSYGEQKRLSVARSLLLEPDYLLFDEPTTGLDPASARSLHQLIRRLAREEGRACLVVSHDMRNALATADRILVLDEGCIVDQGSPEELRRSLQPLTRAFLEDLRPAEAPK